mmetsp:Transcript_51137/g.141536  ORF Transcript_51137/g.141536 Transcript_51137/m.141536 type:complete len:82 (+) Transcript_51137:604-849(+)
MSSSRCNSTCNSGHRTADVAAADVAAAGAATAATWDLLRTCPEDRGWLPIVDIDMALFPVKERVALVPADKLLKTLRISMT